MGPKWPFRARKARAHFLKKWNDIDIFIEDGSAYSQKIYKELINRIGHGCFQVHQVFPLGNKTEVIRACSKDQTNERPRLYVIDGDLDLLQGSSSPDLRHLFRHPVYCLENYLFDEQAVMEILYEEIPEADWPEISHKLDFENFENELEFLIYLFAMFALMGFYAPSSKTVSLGITAFVSEVDARQKLNHDKINTFIQNEYLKICEAHGESNIWGDLLAIMDRLLQVPRPLDLVSGKDFLMPALRWRFNQLCKLKASSHSLYIRLARHSSPDRYAGFAQAVKSAALAKS